MTTVDALGPVLGAGVLLVPAPAAALTGGWLPLAVVLAWLVATLGTAVGGDAGTRPGGSGVLPVTVPVRVLRVVRPVGVPARVFAAAAVARCAGEYVLPARFWYPTVAVLVFAGALAVAVSRTALRTPHRLATTAVLVVLAITVIACFAIGAPGNAAVPPGLSGADDAAMIPAAAALLVFAFGGGSRGRRGRMPALAVAGVVCLIVVFAVLRQLGAGRLAASPSPVGDALAAADGAALVPLLLAGVVLAALSVAYGAVTETTLLVGRRGINRTAGTWCVVTAAVVVALLLPVVTAVAVAVGCLLLEWLCRHVSVLASAVARARGAAASGRALVTAVVGAVSGVVLSVLLLVSLPLAAVAIAIGVAVLAVSLGAWWRRRVGPGPVLPSRITG